jgi:hypothetical protein
MTGVPLPEQVVPVSDSNNGNRPPGNQGIVRPQRPRLPRPRPSTKPNTNNNRRPQPIPSTDIEQQPPPYKPGIQAEDNKMSTKLTEDQGNQKDESEFTTPQAPATLQEEEEFAINRNTTASKSQTPPVDMPSLIREEDRPVTTEYTGNEMPDKKGGEQDKHVSSIASSAPDSSREELKIIATLTSSSSTVNEATQEALSVLTESTNAEVVMSGGSTPEEQLLEPSKGVGFATPVLESSMQEILTHDSTSYSELDGLQSPATSAGTPTSFLPSILPSSSGDILLGVTNTSSSVQEKLKKTTGKFKI